MYQNNDIEKYELSKTYVITLDEIQKKKNKHKTYIDNESSKNKYQ